MARLLHVEDNPNDRMLVRRELVKIFPALEIHEIRNASEFDAALEAGDFDLTITDYQIRWIDGVSVLLTLKSRFPDRPVIMYTGSGNEDVAVDAMKAGLDDYVVKSSQHAIRLVTAVRSALAKSDAQQKARQAERDREELLVREQAARAEAERLLAESRRAEQRKDEFLAMLAHELRNPLAPITNAVHLLAQPGLPDAERQRTHDILVRQTRHLASIVDDLLDVTRITRGSIELRRERVDLCELLREAFQDYEAIFRNGGLRAHVDAPRRPVWVWGDRTRLYQALGNLLQNAAKFTEPAGEVVATLTVDAVGETATLEVRDNGLGMDADLLPRLFETFTQGHRTLDRSQGGLGLGLALVKGVIELHGGSVTAASDGVGRGSTFTLRLPLDTADRDITERDSQTTRYVASRVLVVEDSPDGAESLRLVLELMGHDARVVHTGAAAIDIARQFRPAVVLCDLGLPGGMSGYEVALALRHDPLTATARLIAVSGYGQPEDVARARMSGFDLHLTKPVNPEVLERHLLTP